MRDSKAIGTETGSETRAQHHPGSGKRPSPLGWTLVAGAIAALVYIPAVLTGAQDPWQQSLVLGPGPTPTPEPVLDKMDDIPVDGPFAVTVGYEFVSSTSVDLHLLVGANDGTGNTYRLATGEDIPTVLLGTNVVRLFVPGDEPFIPLQTITVLNGSCCAADQGFVDNGIFHTILTTPGLNTQEALISVLSTNTASLVDFPGSSQLSAWLDMLTNADLVASTYNTSTSQVQIFTRSPSGAWTPLENVPMDSPFTNSHWGQASDPDGDKIFVIGRNNGPVQLTQVDAGTGNQDWTTQVDFQAAPPTGFRYFQIDWSGQVDLPGGGTGDAIAFFSPSDTEVDIGLVAPVGGPSPPNYLQIVTFPGSVTDRQAFSSDHGIIHLHFPDPDGTGVQTSVINCNGLAGPCTHKTYKDDSRDILWSGFAPDTMVVQGSVGTVIPDRRIIVEGTPSNVVSVWAGDLPQVVHNHESGELQWNNVVGGSEERP